MRRQRGILVGFVVAFLVVAGGLLLLRRTVVVALLAYPSMEVQGVWRQEVWPCIPGVTLPDGLLGWLVATRIDLNANQSWQYERHGTVSLVIDPPSDFGGFAVVDNCGGALLYAGSIVWMGRGNQLFPDPPSASTIGQWPASETESTDQPVFSTADWGRMSVSPGQSASIWQAVRMLKVVQDMGEADGLVLRYSESIGGGEGTADHYVVVLSQ